MTSDLNALLERVAAGELSPAEAAELLERSGPAATGPAAPPAGEETGPARQLGRHGRSSFDELVSHAVRELMPNVQPSALIGAHSVGVTIDYARRMKDILGEVDISNLTGAKSTGVTTDYAAAMRELFAAAPVGEVIDAKVVGISPQQVAAYLELNPSLTLRQVMQAINAGLSPDQIRHAAGPQLAP